MVGEGGDDVVEFSQRGLSVKRRGGKKRGEGGGRKEECGTPPSVRNRFWRRGGKGGICEPPLPCLALSIDLLISCRHIAAHVAP